MIQNTFDTSIERRISVLTATSIVIANIIGAGIFTTTGIIATQLPGPGWVLLCWLFGGLIAISGSLCYAELATRMPEEGAEYFYLRRLYHPSLGFLTGWTSFIVGFSAAIAASAMGFSEYIFAGRKTDFLLFGQIPLPVIKKIIAIGITLLFTAVHYAGIRLGAGVQNILTIIKIIIVLGLASTGLILGDPDWQALRLHTSGSSSLLGVGTAMMLVMFAYSGWNASAYIAGEIKNPKRSLPLSLLSGTSIVIALYLAVNLFVLTAVPYAELQGAIPVVEKAATRIFGPRMGDSFSLLISFALLSSLSAYILIGPRVYYAMARDKLFFSFASSIHPRFGVPGMSILLQGMIAAVLILFGTFEQLLLYLGFSLGIFPWLAVAGLFIARHRRIGEDQAVPAWGYPFVPLFFLASTLFLMVIAFLNRPLESSAAILTILAGVPIYFLWIRAKARHRSDRQ